MMKRTKFESVNQYIDAFPKNVRVILQTLRKTIKKSPPRIKEKISYNIPTFTLYGKYLVYIAGYKKHIGFYPASKAINIFKKDLAQYKLSKGTIQFPLDNPIPLSLVTKIVTYRIKENSKLEKEGKLTVYSRGHKFYKNNKIMVCPVCWPGRYKKEHGDS